MTEVVVTTLTRQDLEALVIDCMKVVIKNHQPAGEEAPSPGPGEPEFLTKRQAARKLGCSTSTIDNAARAGKLTRHYLGKTVRFRLEEVLALAKPAEN
ncbi:MAG: helix-turn-helix domain-containing protein [Phaeodactylibacter sp.]|nr:helix-turn-helix domain-containing protein [Phaeodactylibacter sp.]